MSAEGSSRRDQTQSWHTGSLANLWPDKVISGPQLRPMTNGRACTTTVRWKTLADSKSPSVRGCPPVYIVAMQKSASEYLRWVLTEALLAPSFYPSSGTFPHDMLVPNFVRIV